MTLLCPRAQQDQARKALEEEQGRGRPTDGSQQPGTTREAPVGVESPGGAQPQQKPQQTGKGPTPPRARPGQSLLHVGLIPTPRGGSQPNMQEAHTCSPPGRLPRGGRPAREHQHLHLHLEAREPRKREVEGESRRARDSHQRKRKRRKEEHSRNTQVVASWPSY